MGSIDNQVYLIGGGNYGGDSLTSSEILSPGSDITTEGFKLEYDTWGACNIATDDNQLIITGGEGTKKTVSLYNREGWVRNLASLNTGRSGHACGKFKNSDNDVVYLVSGGYGDVDYLSSTVILLD